MSQRELNDQQLRRREELEHLREMGIEPYPYSFDRTHSAEQILSAFSDEAPEAFASVGIAGRIMALRRMGKAVFMHILDASGKIQVYVRKDDIENFEALKLLDIGDIVGVRGFVFRTRTGEISVHTQEFTLLAKSLEPIPIAKEVVDEEGNKTVYDAFADKELRYRQRYKDLIVNPHIREVFVRRSRIISAMRRYFDSRGWLEVETPVLQPLYGGASARPFTTHHNALDMPLYLRIATELYLKRLLVGGLEGVYEIGKNFRNEGISKKHNPEFTAMEIYVAYKDYVWMMDMVEDLLRTIAREVLGAEEVEYDGKSISFSAPFARIPMLEAIHSATGINVSALSDEELVAAARSQGIDIEKGSSRGTVIDEIFSEKVEHTLVQPTFITDYPVEMSPLAKRHRADASLTERFELYINGAEVANAFSELNDPIDQRRRLEEQAAAREGGDAEAMGVDEDFLHALEVGMPPAAGLGIGIDRLVMFLTNSTSIRDVLFFPHMRPEHL